MVSETKIDVTFLVAQFCVEGYCSPYRIDRICKGEGALSYVNEDIPSKQIKLRLLKTKLSKDFLLKLKKCLLCCSYNPNKNKILFYLYVIAKL